MSYIDNFNEVELDLSGVIISGLNDGIVGYLNSEFINVDIGVNLVYSGTELSVDLNPVFDSVDVGGSVASSIVDIITNVSGVGALYFSDTSSGRGRVSYDHSSDTMSFFTGASSKMSISGTTMTVGCSILAVGLRNLGALATPWNNVYGNSIYGLVYAELGQTMLNDVIYPSVDNSFDVGSSGARFKAGYYYTLDATTLMTSATGTFTTMNATTANITTLNISSVSIPTISCTTLNAGTGNITTLNCGNTTVNGYLYPYSHLGGSIGDPIARWGTIYTVDANFSGSINTDVISCNSIGTGSIDASTGYYVSTILVLDGTTLGSGVVNSSLTSVGTLVGGLNIANGTTYKINGTMVLSGSSLGSGIVGSSLTTLGTLTGLTMGGNVAPSTNNTRALGTTALNWSGVYSTLFAIGANTVLSGTTLGSTIVSSSLTSLGNLTALNMAGNIVPTTNNSRTCGSSANNWSFVYSTAYAIGSTTVLSGTTLGSSIVNSSLTSVGTLTSLTVNGNILPATDNVRTLGSSSFKWASVNSTAYAIGANTVLSGATLGSSIVSSSLTSVGVLTSLTTSGGIQPNANGTLALGTTSFRWLVGYINDVQATSLTGTIQTGAQPNISSVGTLTSQLNMTANIRPTATNTYNLGDTTNYWGGIVGNSIYAMTLMECRGSLTSNTIGAYTGTAINIQNSGTTATINIGTTSNTSTVLDIKCSSGTAISGMIKFTDSVGSPGVIDYDHTLDTMGFTAGGNRFMVYQTGADDVLYINAGDRIQQRWYRPTSTTGSIIRCYSDNGGVNSIQFRIGGTGIVYAQSTTISSVSDFRKKENIIYGGVNNAMDRWVDISDKLCCFNWKRSNGDLQHGLIAQDMEALDSNYVINDANNGLINEDGEEDENGTACKVLNGDLLHHIMRSAVGELIKKVRELEARLDGL